MIGRFPREIPKLAVAQRYCIISLCLTNRTSLSFEHRLGLSPSFRGVNCDNEGPKYVLGLWKGPAEPCAVDKVLLRVARNLTKIVAPQPPNRPCWRQTYRTSPPVHQNPILSKSAMCCVASKRPQAQTGMLSVPKAPLPTIAPCFTPLIPILDRLINAVCSLDRYIP